MNYIYLHGYISGPKSAKALYFKKLFNKKNIYLHIPDLNLPDFSELTINSQIQIVNTILKSVKGPVTLIGSSMGGFVSSIIAENNDRIKRLVLLAPAFGFIQDQKKLMGSEILKKWKQNGSIDVFHKYYGETQKLNYSFYKDASHFTTFSFSRNLPALVFHGLQDETIPWKRSLEYSHTHPDSKFILLHTNHSMENEFQFMGKITSSWLGI